MTGPEFIGGTGRISRPTDARVVIAQEGVYVPGNDRDLVQRIVLFLADQDYVGGIFVHDRFGQMPGALSMSDVGLVGSATTPKPAIMDQFQELCARRRQPAHDRRDRRPGARKHGQGDHGSLVRANTFINMAAMGPDFKRRFVGSDAGWATPTSRRRWRT